MLTGEWRVCENEHPSIVWFKRDLRTLDHKPLVEATKCGSPVGLYIVEPSILRAPDYDALHWAFTRECLIDLKGALDRCGIPLFVVYGEAVEVFEHLNKQWHLKGLWSHEETGNALSFSRDRAVAHWAMTSGIPWCEVPTNGVVRRLGSRDHWSRIWSQRMEIAPLSAPRVGAMNPWLKSRNGGTALPSASELGLCSIAKRSGHPLRGGQERAWQLLGSFLAGRGKDYSRRMSSPVTAWKHCSRLSPHLAMGTLSMRSVVHAVESARQQLRALPAAERPLQIGALIAFAARCHWHCHFIQKLESEPAIEYQNFHRGFDGIRDDGPSDEVVDAFLLGQTGFPFVDACMRSLRATGWINFRMRALLTSFAAYHLWIDWRRIRDPMARLFIDYEPGIHYSQLQMQSGVTGINTMRMYNPVKQSYDQDAGGVFIRRWVSELSEAETVEIHEPWKFGKSYIPRLVEEKEAARAARQRIADVRREAGFRSENQRVYARHGSRKGGARRRVGGNDSEDFSRGNKSSRENEKIESDKQLTFFEEL